MWRWVYIMTFVGAALARRLRRNPWLLAFVVATAVVAGVVAALVLRVKDRDLVEGLPGLPGAPAPAAAAGCGTCEATVYDGHTFQGASQTFKAGGGVVGLGGLRKNAASLRLARNTKVTLYAFDNPQGARVYFVGSSRGTTEIPYLGWFGRTGSGKPEMAGDSYAVPKVNWADYAVAIKVEKVAAAADPAVDNEHNYVSI